MNHNNRRTTTGLSGSPSFSLGSPGRVPDFFAGFRKELSDIEAQEQLLEQRAIKMASEIERADMSTMFGGDYEEARQYAAWMTDNLEDFAADTEGVIKFKQMANELSSFIDASEEYKRINFGSAAAGPKQGTASGYFGRATTGVNFYAKDGFQDARTKEDYDQTYLSLQKPRDLMFDPSGMPTLSSRGRIENPFMPQLEPLPFEGGFEWFEKNAKGYKFPDGEDDARAWLEGKAQDETLKRQIVRQYALDEENETPVEDLVTKPENAGFVDSALEDFYEKGLAAYRTHSGGPKTPTKTQEPTARQKNQALALNALIESITPLQESITVAPSMAGGDGFSELRESVSFLANEIDGDLDITPFLPDSLTKTSIDNPRADEQGQPESILVDSDVLKTPSSIAVTADGLLILSGLGNHEGQSIGEVVIDPNTPDGRKAVGSLSGLFRDAYGVSFNEFLRSLNMNFEVPETAADQTFDVNNYPTQQ